LCPIRRKIGHFGDVFLADRLAWYWRNWTQHNKSKQHRNENAENSKKSKQA